MRTEKFPLAFATQRSVLTSAKAILVEQWGQNSDQKGLKHEWAAKEWTGEWRRVFRLVEKGKWYTEVGSSRLLSEGALEGCAKKL